MRLEKLKVECRYGDINTPTSRIFGSVYRVGRAGVVIGQGVSGEVLDRRGRDEMGEYIMRRRIKRGHCYVGLGSQRR